MAKIDGQSYRGATSPWWYDSRSFYELTQAAGARPVRAAGRELRRMLRRERPAKLAADFTGRPCNSLTRKEAETLAGRHADGSRQVKAKRLGAVGPQFQPYAGYAREAAAFQIEPARGSLPAVVPVVVEAWASPRRCARDPVLRQPDADHRRDPRQPLHEGQEPPTASWGVAYQTSTRTPPCPVKAGRGREYSLVVNVTTPYMPITTDGKAPEPISYRGDRSARQSRRRSAAPSGRTAAPTATDGRPPRPQLSPRPCPPLSRRPAATASIATASGSSFTPSGPTSWTRWATGARLQLFL